MDTAALRRVAGWVLLGSIPVVAFLAYRYHARRANSVASIEETVLIQENEALYALVAAAERGALLNFKHALVVVDQGLVQDVLRAALPIEAPVGPFLLRLESAEASFRGGLGLIHLQGKATLIESSVTADLRVYGGLDVVGVDPVSGRLRCHVRVYGVEALQANLLGIDGPLRALTAELSHGGIETLLPFLEIPVRIDNQLVLPAVRSKRLRIDAAQLAIRAEVAEVKVFGGKLWVALEEQPATTVAVASPGQQARP